MTGQEKKIREILTQEKGLSVTDIVHKYGIPRRSIYYVRRKLQQEGTLDKDGRFVPLSEDTPPETVTIKTIEELSSVEHLPEEIENDDKIRRKLMSQVLKFANDPLLSSESRLNATQVWVKLKDIVRQKDLGPGPPKTKDEALERLAKLMKGVGPKISILALEVAFGKGKVDEKAKNLAEGAPSRTSEAIS
jgi:transposase-like protein